MSILKHFENITLTKGQETALLQIEKFLHSDTNVFILKGYAGTGKTTLLNGIANFLNSENRFAHIMAPTGRAAKIIKDKTNLPATTIHKAIYNYDNIETVNTDKEDEHKTFKYYFKIRDNDYNINSVFLVDESSMISNQFNESEFFRFGSGFLLNDLLAFVDLKSQKKQKIIFIGDPAQLPPVSDANSQVFDTEFFKSNNISVQEYELTEVVRQSNDSGILNNSTKIRDILKTKFRSENCINLNFNDIKKIQEEQISEYFFKDSKIELNDRIIITYSNSRAFLYNKIIREQLFPQQQNLVAGDFLQITHNSYKNEIELLNGEIVKVVWADNKTEPQSAPVSIDGQKKIIKLNFRDVEIAVPNYDKTIKCKIIDSYLESNNRDLHKNEMKALYINFVMRFRKDTNGKYSDKSDEFKQAIKNDPYFNAIRAKYGYAITCHKAQGGEWENAFVDFTGKIGTSTNHLRWTYTAITRAVKMLYIIQPPQITPIGKINFSPLGKITKIPANAINYGYVPDTPFHNSKTHPAKRLKYFEIENKLKNTVFHIENVVTKDYLETYNLANDENYKIRIDLNHNSTGIFSFYTSNDKSETANKLISLFMQPYEIEYFIDYKPTNEILNKLYQFVCSSIDEADVRLTNIDDSKWEQNYFVNYFFKTDAECAYIQFFIDKKGKITSAIPKSTLGSEDKKLEKLIELLNN